MCMKDSPTRRDDEVLVRHGGQRIPGHNVAPVGEDYVDTGLYVRSRIIKIIRPEQITDTPLLFCRMDRILADLPAKLYPLAGIFSRDF